MCGINNTAPIPWVTHQPSPKAAEAINTQISNICQSLLGLDLTSLPACLTTPAMLLPALE